MVPTRWSSTYFLLLRFMQIYHELAEMTPAQFNITSAAGKVAHTALMSRLAQYTTFLPDLVRMFGPPLRHSARLAVAAR